MQNNQTDGSSLLVQKCINILRQVSENKEVVTKFYPDLEESLLPLFEHLAHPDKISFEDDILTIVKNLIKRKEAVSVRLHRLLFTLDKVMIKNKNCFGEVLLSTLNVFIYFGRNQIVQDQAAVELILKLADLAIFTRERPANYNNSQGAILL
jgi:hypothetical protein